MADSQSLRMMRVDYLKRKAAQLLQEKDYRGAYDRYTAAMQELPGSCKKERQLLYSNRSHVLCCMGRYSEALADSQSAVELGPGWSKAHWRCAQAMAGLKRWPGAALSYSKAWRCLPGDERGERTECRRALEEAAARLTQREVGEMLLAQLQQLQAAGKIPACIEVEGRDAAAKACLVEAAAKVVRGEGSCGGQAIHGDLRERLADWLCTGPDTSHALMLRCAVLCNVGCFAAAQRDGAEALSLLLRRSSVASSQQFLETQSWTRGHQALGRGACFGPRAPPPDLHLHLRPNLVIGKPSWTPAIPPTELAAAQAQHAEALMAEPGSPDRDVHAAVVALGRAVVLDPSSRRYEAMLKQFGEQLTDTELAQALLEADGVPGWLAKEGVLEAPKGQGGAWRVDCRLVLVLECAEGRSAVAAVGAAQREALRGRLVQLAGPGAGAVQLQRVRPLPARDADGRHSVVVELTVHCGSGRDQAEHLLAELNAAGGTSVFAVGGLLPLMSGLVSAVVEARALEISQASVEAKMDGGRLTRQGGEALWAPLSKAKVAARSTMQPSYQLVTADGRPVERGMRHPFRLTRVYYSPQDLPEEATWVELVDGSCRWRQSSAEIKIIACKVPRHAPRNELDVIIQRQYIRVASASSGEVYLEGRLARDILPEGSIWVHGQGDGEEGFVLLLQKMNLELLKRHWQHANTWWPHLMTHHDEIAWDDYEKDYSDLPQSILQEHLQREAQQQYQDPNGFGSDTHGEPE